MTTNPAILLLEDGSVYHGFACGKIGTATGEICFNTSMTGYQELFTDPSYFGQLLISTNVHVGNYGIKHTEEESDAIQIAGLICRDYTNNYSRKQADSSIEDYFQENNLVGISGIDTRAVVRQVRQKGAMNAIISSDNTDIELLKTQLLEVPGMEGLELSSKVSTPKAYTIGKESAKYKIAALDFGIKKNILRNFENRDCYIKVFPAKTTFEELQSFHPDGYFLSNGPGDPSTMQYAIDTIKQILEENKPCFGICLGNQLLAQAVDIPTYKLHHGHRGGNHPVKNLITGKCEITTQNHGFAVDMDALLKSNKARLTHTNLNDKSVEGLEIIGKNAFAVQYHPEAAPGPHDSRYLFDNFIKMLEQYGTFNS
ncbi:MAG TPA: glutamine-hydrolyzing carbamoyl-phosphate synthase small subunit [Chitinophagales bacterium]|jgi:carbamoyl-phosphate synthase small subunit|nr:glutamine-hydrolyzing carbamoyl-phosphate synthase small subunit [Chitinophagales bacterium]HQV77965.1 glutamine-hydrolyzing carbamoyl-phosphate synthase small subunit [Chitinophagales bacterium]HQW78687.1 glutamine-hydrolyzing carbamoyl-phosphate synthase small subunit [Chitinophagales bacterium]HRB18468.1 glutamine-hydrolyzing carbamoyl-phosphate synthase small subunit [Chitinophagales bacterium]HRB66306.1 glutamine-hydrolyzing carbamoyl-phosphate synthase small subunit [Chitinophagales ba